MAAAAAGAGAPGERQGTLDKAWVHVGQGGRKKNNPVMPEENGKAPLPDPLTM